MAEAGDECQVVYPPGATVVDLGTAVQVDETNGVSDESEETNLRESLLDVNNPSFYSANKIVSRKKLERNDSQSPKTNLLFWIVGDAPCLWSVHKNRSWRSFFAFVKVAESIFRGLGQVCFANNPWSGVLVLIGLVLADPIVGLAAIVASCSSLIMSKILRQPDDVVVSGLQNYSAVLVGTVTSSLFPIFFEGALGTAAWSGILAMSAFSVCIGLGLGALLSYNKIPVFTLPFNITTSLMFLGFRGAGFSFPISEVHDESLIGNITGIQESDIDWPLVMHGVLKSAGQVYAVDTTTGSIVILIGLAVNSPILMLASFVGGLLGSLTALLLTTAPHTAIHAGIWGYNGFLAGGCLAFFAAPSPLSTLVGALNAIFATIIQAGLIPVFQLNNLPVFTYPFCVSSLFFLVLVDKIPGIERVKELSYPEKHLMESRRRGRSPYQEPKDSQNCEVNSSESS